MTKTAFGWLFVLVLSSTTALAQRPPSAPPANQFEIRGKLIFSVATPPEDRIEVHLETNMQRIQTAFTDSLGQFEFRSLAPGIYIVSVRFPGYEDVHQQVEVYNTHRTTTVNVQMNQLFSFRKTRPAGFEGEDPDVVDINQLNKKYPKKALQEYEKALEVSRKGDTAKAIKHLEEAVKLAPDFYHAHNNLGVAYLKAQRFPDAEREYQRARELNPRADQPLVNLAVLYITQSDLRREEGREVFGKFLDDAMDKLDEAIKLRPQSAVAHYYLGTAYYKSDFYDEAETTFKKARQLDPAMGNARLMLVNVYIKLKRWNDVAEQIDAFIQENPKAQERKAMEDLRQKLPK
jgi:tetratricopeptide (TPR) repeat protein